jgi:hypothetical protein
VLAGTLRVAFPFDPTVAGPSVVEPPVGVVATNVTVPVVAEATVAVRLKLWVVSAVGVPEVTLVVVAAPPVIVKLRRHPPTVDDPLPVLL